MKYFLLAFLIFSTPALGQTEDSLENILQKAPADSRERVDILNEMGYFNWIRDPRESIERGEEALELAQKINYPSGSAQANRVMGVAYWAQGQPKNALENLTYALDLFRSLDDAEGVANSTLNIGMVYGEIGELDHARSLYKEAITEFEALGLQGRIGTALTKLGMIYLEEKNYAEARAYFTDALRIHTDNNFIYGISEAHNRLARLNLQTNQLEQAEYHIRQSMESGALRNDEDGLTSNLILLGTLQRMRDQPEDSEASLLKAISIAKDNHLNNYRLAAYKELVNLKREMNQMDSALIYYDAYVDLSDSVFSTAKSKQIAAIEFRNELESKNKELNFLNEKRQRDRIIRWILISGIIVIVSLAFFLLKSLRTKSRNQQELLESRRIVTEKELENQRLRQADLEYELEYKNRELTSYALNFVQKNELLDSLQGKITSLKQVPDLQTKNLNELERIIRQHTTSEKDWEDFRIHFEQVHTQFFKELKEKVPSLSANDLKVAALARLNLSIKESAGILGISPESAKTARYRLRKKLDIAPEEELFDFLLGVDQQNI